MIHLVRRELPQRTVSSMESILALITGTAAVITLSWHDWIEIIFGVDPDQGNGSAEWLVVVILLIVTSVLVLGARLEWRRAWLAAR
jgi:hypothetical protein